MAGLKVQDLVDLAVGENEAANSHVTQIFQWRYEQAMMVARSLAGAGSALIIALALAVVQEQADASEWIVWTGFGAAVVIILIGALAGWRARHILRQYVAAQFLLAELQTIRPFLRRYLFSEGP